MNRVIPLLAFSILLLVPVGAQNAFADIIELKNEADCLALGGTFFVLGIADVCVFLSLTVDSGDTLIIENIQVQVTDGLTNSGTIQLVGGSEEVSGSLVPGGNSGFIVNECGGTINAQGGDESNSGSISITPGRSLTNFGTINLIGDIGSFSGSLLISGTADNHGTINENPDSGPASGIVFVFNVGVFNDDLPSQCAIGGEIIPIETTSLILAGTQSFSWMIPVLLSGIGIGLFVVTRKSE